LRVILLTGLGDLSRKVRLVHNGPGALLDSVVNRHELEHLARLAQPGPFRVHSQEGFKKELEHLRSLNFIKSIYADRGIRSLPPVGEFNLKDFFEITRRGQDYL